MAPWPKRIFDTGTLATLAPWNSRVFSNLSIGADQSDMKSRTSPTERRWAGTYQCLDYVFTSASAASVRTDTLPCAGAPFAQVSDHVLDNNKGTKGNTFTAYLVVRTNTEYQK